MADDLELDVEIRYLAILPISVAMLLFGLLRYFVSELMRSNQTHDAKVIREGQMKVRARNQPAAADFIPANSFRDHNVYYTNERSSRTEKERRSRGLNEVCGISPELQAVLGKPALRRTEIVSQLWAYIKKHNLQDPSNRRKIICDDALRVVFEMDSTNIFNMDELLSKHIIRLEPNKESKRTKVKSEAATGNSDSAPPPVTISEALSNFLGTGDREMQQSEVLGRVWEYIKDPQHPVVIICDEKLKELLGCESISMMGISEILTRHHILKR